MTGAPIRRALLGALAALPALWCPSPADAALLSPDAGLLALCRAYHANEDASFAASNARDFGSVAGWGERMADLARGWERLVNAIAATPAETPEGLQAKARVLCRLMGNPPTAHAPSDPTAFPGRLGWSLAADLIGSNDR